MVLNKDIFLSQYVRELELFVLEDQKETTFLGRVAEDSGLAQYCLVFTTHKIERRGENST